MNAVAKPQAFQAMTADLTVSMDDVVSAFVSQYENNLFARKKEISESIRAIERDVDANTNAVKAEVTGDEWVHKSLPLDLSTTVKLKDVDFEDKEVTFSVEVKGPNSGTGYYRNTINLTKTKKIPAKYVTRNKKLIDQLNELRAELGDVLTNLKTIARKERQVRGKIAIRKLEDAGYASLMADPELIALVQLEE